MKTVIQQIKDYMANATKSDAYGFMMFHLDNADTRNKRKQKRAENYAERVRKIGTKKWGEDWWKK